MPSPRKAAIKGHFFEDILLGVIAVITTSPSAKPKAAIAID